MSDVFRLCVGHFHIVLDIFFFFNNANQFKDKEWSSLPKFWTFYIFTVSRSRSKIQDCLRKFGKPENVSDIVSDV